MGVIDFCKKYYAVVGFLGGILLILNYTGFSLNIYGYYKGLAIESKILFVFIINTLITALSVVLILNRIKASSLEKKLPSKKRKK